MTTTPTSGAADLPEALRSIQRFEVVDCIDDKHVPAVIPKPHGPWVRYADHVTALAAGQATAPQQEVPDECFPGEPKVAVPQGLIGAACFAIRNNRNGSKVLEQLRRYSVGDQSQPLAPQPSPTAQAAQADSVQEDAARLDFLIEQRAYVVSDPDACPGYWLHWAMPDGRTWVQGDEHPTPRAAIDAARKQGARWQSAVRALTLHI